MGWLAAIGGLAGPMVARVLLALGMSVVTFTGFSTVISSFKSEIINKLAGSGLIDAIQLAGLAGAWVGLGSIFGAITFAVSFWTLSKAVKIVGA